MRATEQQVKDFKSGLYQHWKGPKYRALFLAQNSTNQWNGDAYGGGEESRVYEEATEEPMVVYVSLDGEHAGNVCARELWQWNQGVEWGDLGVFPRFRWVSP